MFEVKETKDEELMTGTFVDVYEFADRWSRFSTFQKAALKSNSYVGTLDDFALNVGYSAPMGNIYRKQLIELEELGFIHITDFNQKFYEQNKDEFDYYDFEHGPKRKNTKFFFIPNPAKLANMILSTDINKFPDHSGKGPIERKSHDIRDIQNDRRRKMRKNN